MNTIQKSDPITILKKKKKKEKQQKVNLLGDNNFFSPFSSPKNNENLFIKLLRYKISPSSFKNFSFSENS